MLGVVRLCSVNARSMKVCTIAPVDPLHRIGVRTCRRGPSPLSGLWSWAVSGLLLGGLLIVLHPVLQFEDRPSYGGNGNASAYPDAAWDAFPLLTITWISCVIVEQLLPATWRRRPWFSGAVWALLAITSTLYASFFVVGSLAVMCR